MDGSYSSIAYSKSLYSNNFSYEFHFYDYKLTKIVIAYYIMDYSEMDKVLKKNYGKPISQSEYYTTWLKDSLRITNEKGDIESMGFYGYLVYKL